MTKRPPLVPMMRLRPDLLGRELQFPHLSTFHALIAETDILRNRIRIRSIETGILATEWDDWRDVSAAIAAGYVRLV